MAVAPIASLTSPLMDEPGMPTTTTGMARMSRR